MLKNKFRLVLLLAGILFPVCAQQRNSGQSYYDEIIGNLTRQTKLLQDENAKLESKVLAMEQKLDAAIRENQSLKSEMEEIRRMVRKDAEVREAELKNLFSQLDKLAKTPPPPPPPPKTEPAKQPSGPEKYEEYVVTQGVTLSVIAKAYGVSVADIKRANNLQKDFLRVGQKLKIPVK